jgi:serine/threonine-protein kinase
MLKPGSFLGQYEILALLGVGGMGEVYHARDTKVNREVALKLLPEQYARDPERIGRFRREAQLLGQLQHPNIALLYNFEETGSARYLVMEYVPGETLRERIKRGPTPIEESLTICKQVADALEAAHEKAIIHRDLKPANVKLTPEGVVKVLDFGLAKVFAEEPPSDPSDSPTLSAMTRPGTILGTAAYMPPEQARGRKVDKRADTWALGCLLYELLTGKWAFQSHHPSRDREGAGQDSDANSVADIFGAILHKEPDWDALPAALPTNIRQLLRRCLQKDRMQRLHAAGDARIEIEQALREPEPVASVATPVPPIANRRQAAMWSGVALLVGAVIASLLTWSLTRPEPPFPPSPKRFVINLPETDRVDNNGLALSPDGQTLVYIGVRGGVQQLYRRSMDQLEAVAIPGTEDAEVPFFSPDGQWVGFFTTDKLKKVALAGGPAVTLSDISGNRSGAIWSRDDTIVFSFLGSGLLRVSAAGGAPQPVTQLQADKGEGGHRWPDILPGGKAVLFAVGSGTGAGALPTTRIAVLDPKTGQHRILLEGTHPRFLPTGHIVFARPGSLWAVPFDPERLELTGSPSPLLEGVQVNAGGLANYAIADDGSLVYLPGQAAAERRLVWVDRKGTEEALAAPPRNYGPPRLSPDGRRIATRIGGDAWVYDISRDTLTRLTFEPSGSSFSAWTPDGNRVTFHGNRGGSSGLFWKLADGSGSEERIATSEHFLVPGSWSPDGQLFAFTEANPVTRDDLWVLSMDGDRKAQPVLRTPFNEGRPKFSPDGRWLAYISEESGRDEVYVQPYPGPGGKWQISTEGGNEIVWARNGELFYRNGDQMMAVETTTQPTFSAGRPRLLFEGQYVIGGGGGAGYDVSPDGQRFLMIQSRESAGGPSQIQVVLNWFEELKRRVPIGTTR